MDRALTAVTMHDFAGHDDSSVIRWLITAPLPGGSVGLIDAGWALVPLLQVRSGTKVGAAAEARLTAILGVLGAHRLGPGQEQSVAELDQHRRRAARAQRRTDFGASVVVGILLAGFGAVLLWAISLINLPVAVGAAIAVPAAVGIAYWSIGRLGRADRAPQRVRVRGLDVDPRWAQNLPAEHAAAVDLALRLPPGNVRAWTVEPLVIVAGDGRTAVLSEQTLAADASSLSEPSVEAVVELLTRYLTESHPSVLVAADGPRPAWAGRWQDPWQRLAYEMTGDAIEWIQWRGVLAGFTANGAVFGIDLTTISIETPDDRRDAQERLAATLRREVADPNSAVVRFFAGGGNATRSSLSAILASRSVDYDDGHGRF
ncbi:hypothetical protein [Tsukamurella tyrosinosolvens]|uniref:hypothetical protein n=1 Tax=Tsukamurella tyrosinosolvens TaxID=57704 RepID=UPI002DD450DF|nr:hypothetical protein [Tsukamurella tyrosinosolvens]MEC4615712.1 hypothetical protein [Tsukamurella tyrosinosolvens]